MFVSDSGISIKGSMKSSLFLEQFMLIYNSWTCHLVLFHLRPFQIINIYFESQSKFCTVRSGIRTHAWRSRLRPERSALDHSAILTPASSHLLMVYFKIFDNIYLPSVDWMHFIRPSDNVIFI